MEGIVQRSSRLDLRQRMFAVLAAVVLLTPLMIVTATPASAACSGNVAMTTASTKWSAGSPSYYASWSATTHTAGSPCVDVNVKNVDWDEQGFVGRYKVSGNWISGDAGWVDIDEGYLGVVISDLTGTGISVRVGAAETSWDIRILT